MDKVKVFFNSTLGHFSQLFTGLELLSRSKKIELVYVMDLYKYPIHIFKIEYNGLNLFFDMGDNAAIDNKIYIESDFYIKRMLLQSDGLKLEKLIPYGFNYQVYLENPFLRKAFLKNKEIIKYSLRYHKFLAKILGVKDSVNTNSLVNMESRPAFQNNITFRARLWNPDNNETPWKKEERKVLNDERISINRLLNMKYSQKFKGGIQEDSFSQRECPDLLLNKKEYHKNQYLKVLKQSGIGIVNQGLEGSISWKFGEYIAHSLAIVTTPINDYVQLGTFKEGKHYLAYTNTEECLEKTDILFRDQELRTEMQKANWEYYNEYLHPARKLQKIFEIVRSKNQKNHPV